MPSETKSVVEARREFVELAQSPEKIRLAVATGFNGLTTNSNTSRDSLS